SMGDTKTPVKISIITNILNIIGNYILIFGIGPFPEHGYKGAAISTLISSLIQGLALIIVILKRSNAIKLSFLDLFKPDFCQIKKIIGVGYPMSIDGFYWQGARMFYTMVFNFISSGAYAAYSIVKNFKGMAFLPASGLAQGIMISVGHNLGKRKMKNAVLFAKLGIKIGLLIITIPALILIIFSYNLINIYKVQPDTFFTAWICVLILGVSLYFTVLNSIIPGVLRAGGQTKSVMLITLISFIAVGAPLSLILGVFLKFGAIGAFVGITIEEIIKSFIFYRQLKKYLWLKKLN
ncbi:MAG: polysaccharide biosynthesis C-terminal domain-containing protein, partial [Spirochaetes bacterium]|nr:polysaccharide biosynthesis C-terminal domain-containing protein [Spirochaetota bacterium]